MTENVNSIGMYSQLLQSVTYFYSEIQDYALGHQAWTLNSTCRWACWSPKTDI